MSIEGREQVIKHLEMIQSVIDRLGHDSFLVKGWSMAIIAAGMFFIARSEIQSEWFMLTLLIPVVGFWILDGFFLWQERLFREVYDEVRKQENTDFAMYQMKHKNKPNRTWLSAICSKTLILFYLIELSFVLASSWILFHAVTEASKQ